MELDAPNIQALWGAVIVEELVRLGVRTFVVAPGSRSTPLVQAIARHEEARAVVWTDERGAAFRALGEGRAGTAAAVVTTSGTAVANLLPAVVEASQDGVPLILLTADRPPELREVGANQSIRQTGIFSDYLRWSFDLPVPDDHLPVRSLLTAVDHAEHRASDGRPGPVQLNCPFREPLAPDTEPWDRACLEGLGHWLESGDPYTSVVPPELMALSGLDDLAADARAVPQGLIVVGTNPWRFADEAIVALADALGWPLWADVRSGLRLGGESRHHLAHVDRLLGGLHGFAPEMVLQLGGRLTSKRLRQWLDAGHARRHVLVDPDPARLDPGHRVTDRHVADLAYWCMELTDQIEAAAEPLATPAPALAGANARVEDALAAALDADGALSEPWVARWLSRHMDAEHALFVSNSLPIRDLQQYAVSTGPALEVAANRGASGIDGIVSSAAGFAEGHGAPTTLLLGDLALLHDLNALAHLGQCEHALTIVLLNNGGGGIFSFLPVAAHEDVLTPLVETPHELEFEGVCASFGLRYARVDERPAFERAYREAVALGRPALIEVRSSLAGNRAEHERLEALIEEAIAAGTA